MVRIKCRAKTREYKRLNAQEVHRLVSEVLQEHVPLPMEGRTYEAQDIWDVLLAAAAERLTIEGVSEVLEAAPSANTVRNVLRGILPDNGLDVVEDKLNMLVTARLPPKLLTDYLPCAIDITEIAYHGQHEESDEGIRRGKAKSGTTHFHCYATLYTVKRRKRYTLALTLVRRSDTSLSVLQRLLARGKALGLHVQRLYLDRGFDNNGVRCLLENPAVSSDYSLDNTRCNGWLARIAQGTPQFSNGIYTHQPDLWGTDFHGIHRLQIQCGTL